MHFCYMTLNDEDENERLISDAGSVEQEKFPAATRGPVEAKSPITLFPADKARLAAALTTRMHLRWLEGRSRAGSRVGNCY